MLLMHFFDFLFVTSGLFCCAFLFPFGMTNSLSNGIGCTTCRRCTTSK